ncbi:MAG: hypothetical protein QOG67_3651 [Verrucomicrobiota bacterium]
MKLNVSGAAKIKVTAEGTVRTGGWTEPELKPSEQRPGDIGTADVVTVHFDFVATKPTGAVAQQITPIAAESSLPAPGAGKTLKVVVYAETNEKEDSIKSPIDPQ